MEKTWRVAEIFGPTIQGEGRNVGMPCIFIRFGGCDFRCVWCDTPHAVLPDEVAKLPRLDKWKIIHEIHTLSKDQSPDWIVLSGGNPGLLDLQSLIDLLHVRGHKVMLETQGTTYREWYHDIDDLCFSPKPPSAGNITDMATLNRVMDKFYVDWPEVIHENPPYFKVAIFSDEDLDYAHLVRTQFPDIEMFLSVGNNDPYLPTVGNPEPGLRDVAIDHRSTREIVLNHFSLILDKVLKDQRFDGCRIFPQQHVLVWGNERGR